MTQPELTRNQQLVYDTLTRTGRVMSAYDLLDNLRPEGLRAPVQVYRALEKLADHGLIHRIESMNAYVACSHSGTGGHDHAEEAAFAICEVCGAVTEFSLADAKKTLAQWTRASGFRPRRMTLEVRGRCQACA